MNRDHLFYRAVGKRIAGLRQERQFTQRELGERIGVTQGAIFNYELAVSRVPAAVLVQLARIFGVSVESLLGLELVRPLRLSPVSPAQRRHVDQLRKLRDADRRAVLRITLALAKEGSGRAP